MDSLDHLDLKLPWPSLAEYLRDLVVGALFLGAVLAIDAYLVYWGIRLWEHLTG